MKYSFEKLEVWNDARELTIMVIVLPGLFQMMKIWHY